MISFIICSTHKKLPNVIYENIEHTVRTPYEVIVIDNSQNSYSIFSAYNEGVRRACYPYLCFIHEDIMFRTDNVGEIIVKSFEDDPALGLLGVIGITVLPKLPFGWWAAGRDYYVGGVRKCKTRKMTPHFTKTISKNYVLDNAVACDGLFLCIRREMFHRIRWDEDTFNGFHCYDLDICMQVIELGMKIKVTKDIVIEHFSTGNPSESFAKNCWLFYKKWESCLPVFTKNIGLAQAEKIQASVYCEYLTSYPLAVRYRHILHNKIGFLILKMMKAIKNIEKRLPWYFLNR